MSERESSEGGSESITSEEMMSALFAQLVIQQSNMAMMLLGKVAHPQTGQVHTDIEAARLFIDQLEMLEAKTKGNLSKEESALLKQSLMTLRMAFVDAVDSPKSEEKPPATAVPQSEPKTEASSSAGASAAEDEHRKKFSKKY